MNKKKIGKKKRIRARALDPYKRVNVCVPLDVYRFYQNDNPNGEPIGALMRRALTGLKERFEELEKAGKWESFKSKAMKAMQKKESETLAGMRNGAGVLPMHGKKQGKKDSKPPKMADLVE